MEDLDLYAKIEPLIGFYDTYELLYQRYLTLLSQYDIKTILDVGCGNGTMLLHLQKSYEAKGIDISPYMVVRAKKQGVDASCQRIEDVSEKFDAILAVADVLNYLDFSALKSFLAGVSAALYEGGIFICDINTLFGFEEVTAGSMSAENEDQFLAIEADFEEDILNTHITLFERDGECYRKAQADIKQYYYTLKTIQKETDLTLIDSQKIALFGEEADKKILIFQKGSR